MIGGVINTYSILAFAETTFGLLRMEKRVGDVANLNKRSIANRDAIDAWIAKSDVLELGVTDASRRGAAVTLLKVKDKDITDASVHARIIAKSKGLLAYDGINHVDGSHEQGLDVARYVNAFPGTPGDYRAWIGGIRDVTDTLHCWGNVRYAYLRAKIAVLEEELQKAGHKLGPVAAAGLGETRADDPKRIYKVLVCDLIGLKFGKDGKPDPSDIKAYVESKGGSFHLGDQAEHQALKPGIHFFYLPDLSTEAEILPLTSKGQYDAVIAAATFLPKDSVFKLGGVRIGAGTGNMGSASWGGGNGAGGGAPLMNTPSFNSRATAQMTMKALLHFMPDLPMGKLHKMSVAGEFDTGSIIPTEKLEGKTMAVIGYGNIGREVAHHALAFGMKVKIHARSKHRMWIESGRLHLCADSGRSRGRCGCHQHPYGPWAKNANTGRFENAGLINDAILSTSLMMARWC